MSQPQLSVRTAGPRVREFATTAVAVQAIVINRDERFLLLNSPVRKQGWQLVSGGMEAGETLLEGTLREVAEEIGPNVKLRPLGLIHAESFHYDANVRFMLGTYYLFEYAGGEIVPGDDMVGSEVRWWNLEDLSYTSDMLHVTAKIWMFERALTAYRCWRDEGERPLQPPL